MIIRNPSIPSVDRKLQEIQGKIEVLETKNYLTLKEQEELKTLKKRHATKTFFRVDEIMAKEPKNPIQLVITDSYHFAVALHFTPDNIPICIAKGANLSALFIMKLSLESNIKVVQFKEVARAIYSKAEIYKPIENSMFHILKSTNVDMNFYEAIELAKSSDKFVRRENVIKLIEEKKWEE